MYSAAHCAVYSHCLNNHGFWLDGIIRGVSYWAKSVHSLQFLAGLYIFLQVLSGSAKYCFRICTPTSERINTVLPGSSTNLPGTASVLTGTASVLPILADTISVSLDPIWVPPGLAMILPGLLLWFCKILVLLRSCQLLQFLGFFRSLTRYCFNPVLRSARFCTGSIAILSGQVHHNLGRYYFSSVLGLASVLSPFHQILSRSCQVLF